MAGGEEEQPRWDGRLRVDLPSTAAGEAWAVLSRSFCSLHRLVPAVARCELVDGVDGRPGCVRRCVGRRGDPAVGWAEERLLSVDDRRMSFVYEVVRSNLGFGRFFSTVSVEEGGAQGSAIQWSFTGEPMTGGYWTRERLLKFLGRCLRGLAEGVEAAVSAARGEQERSPIRSNL